MEVTLVIIGDIKEQDRDKDMLPRKPGDVSVVLQNFFPISALLDFAVLYFCHSKHHQITIPKETFPFF